MAYVVVKKCLEKSHSEQEFLGGVMEEEVWMRFEQR